jgi:DNA modification methylase
MSKIKLIQGDCLDKLKNLKDNSVDSIVTDPPYGLSFMGKKWDYDVPSEDIWREALRVLKPGGHLLSFAGSRTYHRMAVRVEDAGFEIRDMISWIYGSGFPKSHNIGKAVDKIQGNEREDLGPKLAPDGIPLDKRQPNKWMPQGFAERPDSKKPQRNTKGNSQYEGWGTALKPAHEPMVLARKPFKGTVASNVLEYGTGGINIDGCRVGNELMTQTHRIDFSKGTKKGSKSFYEDSWHNGQYIETQPQTGRFPANIIFDEEAGKILDEQSGVSKGSGKPTITKAGLGGGILGQYDGRKTMPTAKDIEMVRNIGDTGGASRFFYCPKASKKDRNDGLDYIEAKSSGKIGTTFAGNQTTSKIGANPNKATQPQQNVHPTVKPTDLMVYLVRLVTPKGGTVLDPFMGSGSTGKAAVREGMDFIGIEREDEYMEIAKSRIEHEQGKNKHREFFE